MKAKVVKQEAFEGIIAAVHSMGFTTTRLVIEEKGNLAITLHKKEMHVYPHFLIKEECEVVGEVDVPDEMVEKAEALLRAKAELNALQGTFQELISTNRS